MKAVKDGDNQFTGSIGKERMRSTNFLIIKGSAVWEVTLNIHVSVIVNTSNDRELLLHINFVGDSRCLFSFVIWRNGLDKEERQEDASVLCQDLLGDAAILHVETSVLISVQKSIWLVYSAKSSQMVCFRTLCGRSHPQQEVHLTIITALVGMWPNSAVCPSGGVRVENGSKEEACVDGRRCPTISENAFQNCSDPFFHRFEAARSV